MEEFLCNLAKKANWYVEPYGLVLGCKSSQRSQALCSFIYLLLKCHNLVAGWCKSIRSQYGKRNKWKF